MFVFPPLRNASINLSIESPILQPYITTLVIPVSQNMKSKKSFFDFDENDEIENFDDDELNIDENNLFNNVNKNKNEIAFAKDSQKKKTR